jgi:hypothetical protein
LLLGEAKPYHAASPNLTQEFRTNPNAPVIGDLCSKIGAPAHFRAVGNLHRQQRHRRSGSSPSNTPHRRDAWRDQIATYADNRLLFSNALLAKIVTPDSVCGSPLCPLGGVFLEAATENNHFIS